MNYKALFKEVEKYIDLPDTLYTNINDEAAGKLVKTKTKIPDNSTALIEFIDEQFDTITTRLLNETYKIIIIAKPSLAYKLNNIYRNAELKNLKLVTSIPFSYNESNITYNYYFYIFFNKTIKPQ